MKITRVKIEIDPQFYLLPAASIPDFLHDSVFTTDNYGLPIIKGTKLKGLLRESMEEILSMKNGQIDIGFVNDFFGEGNQQRIDSDIKYISDAELQEADSSKKQLNKYYIEPLVVSEYFSKTINQTKIDSDGIAEEGSLRSFRAISYKDIKFSFYLEIDQVKYSTHKELMTWCVLNTRYLGLNRNRGIGEVRMSIISEEIVEIVPPAHDYQIDDHSCIEFTLTTLTPALMASQVGDQNTITTETVISGNKIIGALASFYTNNFLEGDYSQQDEFLSEFIYNEEVKVSSARFENIDFLPYNIQFDKYNKQNIINKFSDENRQVIGKPITDRSPVIAQSFHNSRSNRVAGVSLKTDEEGSIFYREFIVPQQEFIGKIMASKEFIQHFCSIFPPSFEISIGSAKTSRYGKFDFNYKIKQEEVDKYNDDKLYFVLQSPCILLDEYNEYRPSLDLLCQELGIELAQITNSFLRFTSVQSYSNNYKAFNKTYNAIEIKSVIEYSNSSKNSFSKSFFIGEFQKNGFGEVLVLNSEDIESKLKSNDQDVFELDEINNQDDFIKKIQDFAELGKEDKYILDVAKVYFISNSFITELISKLDSVKDFNEWNDYLESLVDRKRKELIRDVLFERIKYSEDRMLSWDELKSILKADFKLIKARK